MRKILAFIGILSISWTSIAEVCNTRIDTNKEDEKIKSEWFVSDKEEQIRFYSVREHKARRIIVCAETGLQISPEDSKFAIDHLKHYRNLEISNLQEYAKDLRSNAESSGRDHNVAKAKFDIDKISDEINVLATALEGNIRNIEAFTAQ